MCMPRERASNRVLGAEPRSPRPPTLHTKHELKGYGLDANMNGKNHSTEGEQHEQEEHQ